MLQRERCNQLRRRRGSLADIPLADNHMHIFAMKVLPVQMEYEERHCSAVIPRAVIWVNAYKQDGIFHILGDKLPPLWFPAYSMCAADAEGAGVSRLDRDELQRCIAQLIHRAWPTGDIDDRRAFPSYMRELLHAVSDHAPSTPDLDDVVTAANECALVECRRGCFHKLSIYYDYFMYHGDDERSGSALPKSFWPQSALDERFFLWPEYRAHLLVRLGVNLRHNATTLLNHMVFLRRSRSRRTMNHRFLCAVNSGVGNALFLPPNSGILELQPKPVAFQSFEPFTHDVMFIFLWLHHIKYNCLRNFVLPMELSTVTTFAQPAP